MAAPINILSENVGSYKLIRLFLFSFFHLIITKFRGNIRHQVRQDSLHLPREVRLLIDRYISEQNALGSRYGVLAYLLGFSDCVELLFGSQPFSDLKEVIFQEK